MAAFLVELGIDSMSLNPDTVLKTTRQVLELEETLAHLPRQGVRPASGS
jgi:pyruvate,water dikinase